MVQLLSKIREGTYKAADALGDEIFYGLRAVPGIEHIVRVPREVLNPLVEKLDQGSDAVIAEYRTIFNNNFYGKETEVKDATDKAKIIVSNAHSKALDVARKDFSKSVLSACEYIEGMCTYNKWPAQSESIISDFENGIAKLYEKFGGFVEVNRAKAISPITNPANKLLTATEKAIRKYIGLTRQADILYDGVKGIHDELLHQYTDSHAESVIRAARIPELKKELDALTLNGIIEGITPDAETACDVFTKTKIGISDNLRKKADNVLGYPSSK